MLAARSGVPLTLTEKSNVKWSTRASEQRYRTDVHRNVDFLFGPYLRRCHPPIKWVTEQERIKRGRGEDEWKETTRRRRKSSGVGRAEWRKCWQAGARWQESGTATQLCFSVEGPSRLVSLYFIVREKKERETLETLWCTEKEEMNRMRQKKKMKVKKRQTDPGAAALILPAGVERGGWRKDLVMAIERW